MKTYYGYQIIHGEMTVDEKEARIIRDLFEIYLTGNSLVKVGEEAGLNKAHGFIGRILENPIYMGTDSYPEIVSIELYEKVQKERERRKNKLGRNFDCKPLKMSISTKFRWKKKSQISTRSPTKDICDV
ncbi:recombinase family protein [Nosocomiicoccus massiliensis]|uniref:recombinase family protein n=1 Tax=Nosocomiicoccus massiliensis TaxID=1232430 RepID=UPI0006941E16|nr:recombinase family protein [Nosocomiicoccus massiliensis]